MKLYKLMFLMSMIFGTMVAISSYSWFSMWMGLEINLLSVIPLFSTPKNMLSSESAMKYFITQAMASLILLMAVILMLTLKEFIIPQMNFFFSMMLNSALLTKLGAAPFHFWFPEVMEGLNWVNCMILLTWQKIAPMILIVSNKINQNFLMFVIMSCLTISVIMAFNQISMRKIMAFSSINHIAWMLSSLSISVSAWTIYLMFYIFMNVAITLMFKIYNIFYLSQIHEILTNKIMKLSFSLNFMSLGGLPPFMGFFPKWIIINSMISNSMYLMAFSMISLTLVMLFIYMRIMFSSILINLAEPKFNEMKIKSKFTFMMNFIIIFSLPGCTLIFNLM